jgi:ABC-2 type transport system permease protein
VTRRQGLRLQLGAVAGRAYPRVVGSNRDRTWLFYDTLLPLLGTIAFVYVYKALGAPERFVGYVIMGGATMAFWMNILWGMAAQFYWDKQGGNLELYMVAPCGLVSILLGMSVGGLFATVVRATAIVVIGALLFGVSFGSIDLPQFILVFSLTMAALYGLGILFASLFLMWGREAWHTANLFMEPVFLASGFYFPVSALGLWAWIGISVIPLALGLDAMRQLLYGPDHPGFLPIPTELAILAVMTVVFALLGRLALRRMELLARREARLSLRF